jgi:cytochrome c biogenesis protein CcmG/thiol:disulfide interchange protein DsbE
MSWARFTPLLILFCALSALADSNPISALHLDKLHENAPDLVLLDSSGKTTHLSDYHGKLVILHFWASWCTPCLKELPDLEKLAQAGQSNGVVFLPVSADEVSGSKKAQKFLSQVQGGLPFFLAASGDHLDRYLTWGIPVTYFIDGSGKLLARAMGPRSWSSQKNLSELLSRLFQVQNK